MLDLNELLAAFAAHLSAGQSLDKSLAHVCQLAYQRGLEDGAKGCGRAANSVKVDWCHRCGGSLKPGIALQQTATGAPDFQDGEVVTLSAGGPGRLIGCLKCEACGWSVETP